MSTGFYPLSVADVRRETADAISVRLVAPADIAHMFAFRAGQHITLRKTLGGEELRRNYSLCVSPLDGELRIAIKHIAGGRFSGWASTALQAGQSIEAMPPHGSFTWAFDPTARNHYVGFAGGSGITPVLSLLKTALRTEPASQFTLLYGNRTSDTVIFLEELAGLKNRYLDRLEIYHFLDEEEEDIALFNGRLDRAKCDDILSSLVDPFTATAFFICGPGPMMDAAESALLARGVSCRSIFIERFTADRPTEAMLAAARALETRAEGLSVSITLEGRRRSVPFSSAAGSILESARAAGLNAPFACKGGVCATCRARVLQGEVDMKVNYGLSAEELAQGYVLTCQAVPLSADVVIDYDG